jgi:hypothetical protein
LVSILGFWIFWKEVWKKEVKIEIYFGGGHIEKVLFVGWTKRIWFDKFKNVFEKQNKREVFSRNKKNQETIEFDELGNLT